MFLKAYMLLIAEIIGMSINMHKAKKCATISHRNVHQVVSYIYKSCDKGVRRKPRLTIEI